MLVSKGKSNARRTSFSHHSEAPSLKLVSDNPGSASKKEVVLKARTPGQRFYIKELLEGSAPFVIATGPAGTGKTYAAVLYAIKLLRTGKIKKIIITRPNVGAGDDLGFLPGDVDSKMAPWMNPILDAFHEYYSAYEVDLMIKAKTIEMAPLVFMRGRTLKNAIVIGDEMQNATPEQMKMFLTRIGEGSRYIVTGDMEQWDREQVASGVSGLNDLMNRLAKRDPEAPTAFAVFPLGARDVVRHEAIPEVLEAYAA